MDLLDALRTCAFRAGALREELDLKRLALGALRVLCFGALRTLGAELCEERDLKRLALGARVLGAERARGALGLYVLFGLYIGLERVLGTRLTLGLLGLYSGLRLVFGLITGAGLFLGLYVPEGRARTDGLYFKSYGLTRGFVSLYVPDARAPGRRSLCPVLLCIVSGFVLLTRRLSSIVALGLNLLMTPRRLWFTGLTRRCSLCIGFGLCL